MTSLHLLGEGEDRHGDLARDKMGHIAMALLTFAADNPSFAGSLEPAETDAMRRLLERRGTAADDPGRTPRSTATTWAASSPRTAI